MGKRKELRIEFDVLGDKICRGFFKPLSGGNTTYKASIYSGDGGILFSSSGLPVDVETHFSFNVSEPKVLTMTITPIENGKGVVCPDIEISFDAQFDTFRKPVAKKVSVEPAMAAMTKLDNILYELGRESDYLAHNMGRIDYEHRRMFSFVTVFSIITLVIYLCVNAYEVYSLERFFKKKKMI